MFNELPLAVVTVRFDKQPVTGLQLAALVKQAVEQDNSKFIVQHRYYDGDVMSFGQTSGYPYKHIRVTLSLDGPAFFSPEENYTEVKVASHSWGGSVYAVGYGNQSVIDAVKKLAAELTTAYETALNDGFPEYVAPKGSGGFDDEW
jgi:hypothetical protein